MSNVESVKKEKVAEVAVEATESVEKIEDAAVQILEMKQEVVSDESNAVEQGECKCECDCTSEVAQADADLDVAVIENVEIPAEQYDIGA